MRVARTYSQSSKALKCKQTADNIISLHFSYVFRFFIAAGAAPTGDAAPTAFPTFTLSSFI